MCLQWSHAPPSCTKIYSMKQNVRIQGYVFVLSIVISVMYKSIFFRVVVLQQGNHVNTHGSSNHAQLAPKLREYKWGFNTLRPRQMDAISQTTFSSAFSWNENFWISIKMSLKFVPKGPNNNIRALVQIMAWHGPGDKPLSEPMMVSSTTHICVTLPQWVNWNWD